MTKAEPTIQDYGDFMSPANIDSYLALLPQPEILWRGISRGTVGIVYAPAKTGKTTYSENLAYNMAAKRRSFLGETLSTKEGERIALINIEEPSINRLRRHQSILTSFTEDERENINQRMIINTDFHGFFNTEKAWKNLENHIISLKPTILILDSLTRLIDGNSKDDGPILKVMKRLRSLNEKINSTMIIIHHTPKMYGKDIDQDSIAGNHVLQQEIDFAIGLQKSHRNVLIKDVLNRYSMTNEKHLEVKILENQTLSLTGNKTDEELRAEKDSRIDHTNRKSIVEAIKKIIDESEDDIATKDQIRSETGLAQRTYYDNLKKLLESGEVIEVEKTKYKLP